jgi:hypothetical protein
MSENFPLLSDQFKQKTRFNKCNYSLISSSSLNFNISKPDTKLWKTKFLSRSYFTIKNSGNGVSFNQNIVESRSTTFLIKTNFSVLFINWDLNNSYLDNQQLFEANSKSSEPLHKSSWVLADFENTLAE